MNEFISDLEGPSLLPGDAAQRAHARLLIDQVGGTARVVFVCCGLLSGQKEVHTGLDLVFVGLCTYIDRLPVKNSTQSVCSLTVVG